MLNNVTEMVTLGVSGRLAVKTSPRFNNLYNS